MRKLIAAIDPGVNVGVALVDLDSDYFYVFSQRDFEKGSALVKIGSIGDVVMVTTDRSSSERKVKSIAHLLNARPYIPKENIKKKDKINAIRNLNVRFKNQHEKDALATALIAKRRFSKLMEKIDNRLSRRGLSHMSSDIKALVLKKSISMRMALNSLGL